jgi:hypothetical protein
MNFQTRTPLTCGNPLVEKRMLELRQRKHLASLNTIQPVVGMSTLPLIEDSTEMKQSLRPTKIHRRDHEYMLRMTN